MKASMGFGLGCHDRFLIPFMLRSILLDKWCDVGNIIIRLSKGFSTSGSGRPGLLPQPIVLQKPLTILVSDLHNLNLEVHSGWGREAEQ
jgi:hypothetical protein